MSVDRLERLRASSALTGIDFIQVSPSQTELIVFLVHEVLPAPLITALNGLAASAFTIVAEDRVDPPAVRVTATVVPVPLVDGRRALVLTTERPGGFGHYRLRIASSAIDPYFNDVRFSFKAVCPSDSDCRAREVPCPQEPPVDFPVDYRARDFGSFRQALIDFASQRYPDWQDRVEADVGVMVLELLAALGDEFAYAQDRLARESRLESASQRRSLRHLARLVDYPLDNGSGAFAWLEVTPSAAVNVAAGTVVSDAHEQVFFELGHGLRDLPTVGGPVMFAVDPARSAIPPHLWDEKDTCLKAGSTTLTLRGAHAAHLQPDASIDPRGRWILLRTQPPSPDVPERRLVVRLAAPPVGGEVDPLLGVAITRIVWEQPTPFDIDLETLVVSANLLPATSGQTSTTRFRIGPVSAPTDPEPNLPMAIERIGIGSVLCESKPGSPGERESRVKFLHSLEGSDQRPLVWLPARTGGGGAMRPEIDLVRDADGPWSWLPSLIGEETAAPTAKVFTLEDGIFRRVVGFERFGKVTALIDYASSAGVTVRFGDGSFGLAPTEGSKFTLRYRLGNGRAMNAAPDTLVHFPAGPPAGITGVTNPLAATGGRDPESNEQIRINAPQAFRAVTHRAVRAEDYAEQAGTLPWVQQAGAVLRWTGSWPTVFVTPDPRDSVGLESIQRQGLERHLDRVRQAGREVKVMAPRYADLDITIHVCVAPNAYPAEVREAVIEALFGLRNEGGLGGFFDPDNFRFGTPLSRDSLVAVIQGVPGVRAVEDMSVRRRGWFDWRPFTEFALSVGMNELVRVAARPESGQGGAVTLVMEGGA